MFLRPSSLRLSGGGAVLALAMATVAVPAWAQPVIPAPAIPVLPLRAAVTEPKIVIPNPPAREAVVIHVSPAKVTGDAEGDGSAEHPLHSLVRAQAAVRQINADQDVTVLLAPGTYSLEAPLRFGRADGGQNGHVVRWQGSQGAWPVLSGGQEVHDWRKVDAARNIWSAAIPPGIDSRQLVVGGRVAPRASIEIPRAAVTFTPWGLEIVDPAWIFLGQLPAQDRIEVESTGWFTHRHAMVARIAGNRIEMQQPGWRNNLIGYDTMARPVSAEVARLFLTGAPAFLRTPGQWAIDPAAGALYYIPRAGEDMATLPVVLPRLDHLLSISGTVDAPVQDLAFSGLSFRHTSWLHPSGPDGYASQQSGAFLSGEVAGYPADPVRDCSWGCAAFERMRSLWRQQPAAVQVAAARRVVFDDDRFSQLGQIALGIGNEASANASGAALAASSIEVTHSLFEDLAGGAIMAGGIGPDAHHPSRPGLALRDIVIANNTIRQISRDYKEQTGILVTYASGTLILHNAVSDAPYDGIDVGWGWGANDPGGSPEYAKRQRGYYDAPGNVVYDTPTTLRDTVIFGNRVERVKQWFPDGGAIYHLSADPGALIAENYIADVTGPGAIAIYLDEGTRYVTVRGNVIDRVGGLWLNLNSQSHLAPRRTAMDNKATGNWFNGGRQYGDWTAYLNNDASGNIAVRGAAWPSEAKAVIARSGPETRR